MSRHEGLFSDAVSALVAHGNIKHRLVRAFEPGLQHIEGDDLPSSIRGSFAELRDRMSCVAPLNGEGPIRASVRKMSFDEAEDCARLIVTLYAELVREGEAPQEPLPLDDDAERDTPAFLLKSV